MAAMPWEFFCPLDGKGGLWSSFVMKINNLHADPYDVAGDFFMCVYVAARAPPFLLVGNRHMMPD